MNGSVVQPDGVRSRKIALNSADDRLLIADCIEALAGELRSASCGGQTSPKAIDNLPALAKKIYSSRRKIDEIFGTSGFSASPAWDIMLDLYQAGVSGRDISISSASIGAACPPTTALRWMQALEIQGLLERNCDPHDKRRSFVALTSYANKKIELSLQYLLEPR